MAGTSKSYRRKDNPGSPVVKQAYNSQGNLESYNEWDLYLYNPSNDTAVMNVSGIVTSNPGVDAEYIEQGPERDNQTTTTAWGINSYGEAESYEIWNGSSGKQIHSSTSTTTPPETPPEEAPTLSTSEELKTAIDAWIADETLALEEYGDISGWDVSSITNMDSMFDNATAFNSDISSWDTSNVTSMNNMFMAAEIFNQDISSWDTSNVTSMINMFYGAPAFNRDISGWDISNVGDMSNMFYGAPAFNQDIRDWPLYNTTGYIYVPPPQAAEITVENYGKFIYDIGSSFDLNDVLTGNPAAGFKKETYTLEGTNPEGYEIVWYSNTFNNNYNGQLDSNSSTWVIMINNAEGQGIHVDFSGGSAYLSNGSLAVPSSDITITS